MKHFIRAFLILIILLFCIIASWQIFKKYYLFEMVHVSIEKRIGEQIENEFLFTLDSFSINLFASEAELIGFNFLLLTQTDTVGYFKGDILLDLRGWRNLIFDKQKRIKKIAFNETELYYSADHPLKMKRKDVNDVQEVEIANASAVGKLLFAKKHKEQKGQLTTNFDLAVALKHNSTDEFSIDKLLNEITNFQLTQLHYYLPDGFQQLKIAEVAFSEFDDITIKQLVTNPTYSRKDFAQKKKVATDFVSVTIDSIQLHQFDRRLNEGVFIDQVHIYQPSVDVFKDKNYPDNQEFKAIFVDLLQEFKTPVYIRTATLSRLFIKYTELARGAEEAGYLFFDDTKAKVSNITNIKDSIKLSSKMLIEATSVFNGVGMLKASISYELLPGPGNFSVNGSLSPIDLSTVNTMLSKVAPVEIKSGQTDKLHFNFSGTRTHSVGEMWFEYSDLKLEILEVNNWNNSFSRSLLSSLGNRMLRNANPVPNGTFRVGEIKQDRDITRSMFNYWWISLRSGFLSALGATEEKRLINYKTGEDATFLDKVGLGKK